MKKETVGKFDLEAAFKALDDIEVPVTKGIRANRVDLKERLHAKLAHEILVEDYYDVNDEEDLGVAQEEREAEVAKAKLARIEKIVDLDAETEEDVLPSYVGKLIMQCPQCMTLFYKEEADIETSEENPEVVNINEICQHCGNSSGYTLVGKVGGIDESEAENFESEEVAPEGVEGENELNLDFPEEGEEAPAEGEEDLNLDDLDLDLEEPGEGEEEEEETNESLNNSKLLDKIEDKNELKTDIESKHLTLNEDVELDEGIEHWYHKKFDKPYTIKAQQQLEAELNGECGEISDARRKEIEDIFAWQRDWEARHEATQAAVEETPVEEPVVVESMHNSELLDKIEDKNELKTDIESDHLTLNEEIEEEETDLVAEAVKYKQVDDLCAVMLDGQQKYTGTREECENWLKDKTGPLASRFKIVKGAEVPTAVKQESFEDVEDFDEESFNEHLTKYMTEVYSNVSKFTATNCSMQANKLVVEGAIEFKSGKSKATKFIFESTTRGFKGFNSDFSDTRAFNLKASIKDKKIITEGFAYRYKIGESIVKGSIK